MKAISGEDSSIRKDSTLDLGSWLVGAAVGGGLCLKVSGGSFEREAFIRAKGEGKASIPLL